MKAKKTLTKRPKKKIKNQKNKDEIKKKHMKNCNWNTKLKTKKNYKRKKNEIRMGTEIEKQKNRG